MIDRAAIRHAPAGRSLDAKLQALAAFVEAFLVSFDAGFAGRVATHLDAAVITSRSRRERARLMGEPARYAEVFPAEGTAAGPALLAGASGESYATAHDFNVVVYYGLPPRRGPGVDDTAAIRRLVEGAAGEPLGGAPNDLPGLRVALAAQAYLPAPAGGEMPLRAVRTLALQPVLLADGTSDEWRHEALLALSVLG